MSSPVVGEASRDESCFKTSAAQSRAAFVIKGCSVDGEPGIVARRPLALLTGVRHGLHLTRRVHHRRLHCGSCFPRHHRGRNHRHLRHESCRYILHRRSREKTALPHDTTAILRRTKAIRRESKARYTMVLRDTREPILDTTASIQHRTGLSCDSRAVRCNAASSHIRRCTVTRSTAARSCNCCSGSSDAPAQSAEARWSSDDFLPGFQMNPDACPLECPYSGNSCSARLGAECSPPEDAVPS